MRGGAGRKCGGGGALVKRNPIENPGFFLTCTQEGSHVPSFGAYGSGFSGRTVIGSSPAAASIGGAAGVHIARTHADRMEMRSAAAARTTTKTQRRRSIASKCRLCSLAVSRRAPYRRRGTHVVGGPGPTNEGDYRTPKPEKGEDLGRRTCAPRGRAARAARARRL